MLVALLCFTVLRPEPLVTLDAPIGSLDSVVRTVAERTGETLSVSPSLAREMVRVRVHDVPLPALLKQIAFCTHAEWVSEGKRLRLERSLGRERELEAAQRLEIVARLRKELERRRKLDVATPYSPLEAAQRLRNQVEVWAAQTDPKDPFGVRLDGEDEAKQWALREEHPTARAAYRILRTIDVEVLARMEEREGLTISTHPRGDELPFSGSSGSFIKRYREELAAYAKALAGWQGTPSVAIGETPPARVVLHVSRSEGRLWPDYRFDLSAYDASDREISRGALFLELDPQSDFEPQGAKPRPFALSPRSRAMEAAYSHSSKIDKLSAETLACLKDPERYPFFAFGWSEVVPALAGTSHPNVVANLSDDVELWLDVKDGVADLNLAEEVLADGHEFRKEDAWFAVRPRFPDRAGSRRLDRRAFATLIRAVANSLPISIEEMLTVPEYTRRHMPLREHPLTTHRSGADSPAMVAIESPDPALRWLDALGPTLGNRLLRAGGSVAWPEMGPELRQMLRQDLFGRERTTEVTPVKPPPPDEVEFGTAPVDEFLPPDPSRLVELFAEAVFRAPWKVGDPKVGEVIRVSDLPGVRLQVVVHRVPATLERMPHAIPGFFMRAGGEIGEYVVPSLREPDEDEPGVGEAKPEVPRVRLARRREVILRLWLNGRYYIEHSLTDWTYDPKAPFLPPNELPAAFIREVQRIRDDGK